MERNRTLLYTITATTPPAPALTVDNLRSSPTFSAREPPQRPATWSRKTGLPVVFSLVIPVTFPEDSRMGKRKILTGRTVPGNPGLPEKCPAISLDDAGVTEDGGAGVTVRRREQYFMFDNEVYRAWSNGALVWLDDDPDVCSNGSRLQQVAAGLQQLLQTKKRLERGGNREKRPWSRY